MPERLSEFLELAGSVYLSYKTAVQVERRELLRIVTSNRSVKGKIVEVTLAPPFSDVATHRKTSNGGPCRDTPRTLDRMVTTAWDWLKQNPTGSVSAYLTRRNESGKEELRDTA